ncbi:MAG: hypothetical protein NT049_10735 [Planctomycetota bacterium]|nr:hypothetical protein [Planctomycetota bacterium]
MEERERTVLSGWLMLPLVILLWLTVPAFIIWGVFQADTAHPGYWPAVTIVLGALMVPTSLLFSNGFFTLQPNEARVLVLFGRYAGTVRKDGFHWTNPFSVHRGSIVAAQEGDKPNYKAVRQPCKYHISLRRATCRRARSRCAATGPKSAPPSRRNSRSASRGRASSCRRRA